MSAESIRCRLKWNAIFFYTFFLLSILSWHKNHRENETTPTDINKILGKGCDVCEVGNKWTSTELTNDSVESETTTIVSSDNQRWCWWWRVCKYHVCAQQRRHAQNRIKIVSWKFFAWRVNTHTHTNKLKPSAQHETCIKREWQDYKRKWFHMFSLEYWKRHLIRRIWRNTLFHFFSSLKSSA